jgi:hypothetical protein
MRRDYLYLYGGAVGDTLLGVHLGRCLEKSIPGVKLTLLATRKNKFVEELVRPIPFVSFKALPKGSVGSWFFLVKKAFTCNALVYLEPFSGKTPVWWKVIFIVIALRKGSTVTACSIHQKARNQKGTIIYDCKKDSVFGLVPRILSKWGVPEHYMAPTLEANLYKAMSPRYEKPYIVLHFFAPSNLRSFPTSKSRDLIAQIKKALPVHSILITAAKNDMAKAEKIALNLDVRIITELDPASLVSLLSEASVYVGVDTGITHAACQLGTPSVVLGNLSNPCWLPSYAPQAVILFEKQRCKCNGDKTGECREHTAEGDFYRCLFDIPLENIVSEIVARTR